MFRGWYEHTLDAKGRISVPSKFREVLQEKYSEFLVITNFDNCLACYPQEEWSQLERKVAALPQLKPEVKIFQRYFISGASESPLDGHGRILIPPSLRAHANLERDVVFVGMMKRIEIWSKERWAQEFSNAKEKMEEISGVLSDLGI